MRCISSRVSLLVIALLCCILLLLLLLSRITTLSWVRLVIASLRGEALGWVSLVRIAFLGKKERLDLQEATKATKERKRLTASKLIWPVNKFQH